LGKWKLLYWSCI